MVPGTYKVRYHAVLMGTVRVEFFGGLIKKERDFKFTITRSGGEDIPEAIRTWWANRHVSVKAGAFDLNGTTAIHVVAPPPPPPPSP